MEKKRQKLLLIGWLSAAVVSRILYFFLAQGAAGDTYAYYADTIARAGSVDNPVLSSGLAYAYTVTLADFLKLTSGSIEAAMVFQVLLQMIWLIFFFFGIRLLWGDVAGYISGTVLLASPYVLFALKTIEPMDFLMLHWSILLFLFGVFMDQTAKKGWYRNNTGELFLMLIGFYLGVICTWNYLGFLFLPILVYVLKKNHEALWEDLWKQKNLHLDEKEQLMPILSQCLILIAGMVVGIYATLMKYTGLTGKTLLHQFYWWTDQFMAFPNRCQELAPEMLFWLLMAILAGLLGRLLWKRWVEKAEEKREYEAYQRIEAGKKEAAAGEEEMREGYFMAADGREIKYIDNPLPGPKKHVKKEMDFEIHDVSIEEKLAEPDDFDYKIDEATDFDFK